MTQNVDLQVKVKFVVDPKDLQNALSGGVGGGGGGGGAAAGTKGGAAPGAAGLHMPGSNIPRIALPPGFMSQMQALTRALTAQTVALNSRTRELISSKNSELKVEGQIARFKVQEELAEDKRHRSEMKRRADRMQEVLDAENLAKRIDTERKRRLDKSAQDEAQSLRKSQLSARRVGKGYGSEGMFAAGTSPIMQGLAWQSLFATGDILGPMSFAPMALYQNFSLRRQRRNRGFDLGAGSDLAKAAGVGDTGQIATAGHALAALRANTALTPEERERRMAQVDIMSAGRVRGRLGRGIEMFESGQLGGGAVRALGGVVGALGGVASVATGAVAGVGAFVMAMNHLDERMKDSVNNIRSITDSMETARRTSRRSEQLEFEGAMAGAQGSDLSVLARAGLTGTFTPQMRSGLAKIGRAAGPEKMKALVGPMLQAARMFDVQPEDILSEVAQSGAYRLPVDKMINRIPRLLAQSMKATPQRRKEMGEMWAKRSQAWTSSGTDIGDLAEKYRSDAAFAEGMKIDRGRTWDATRIAEIERLKEEAAKLRPDQLVERETIKMKINSLAQDGMSLTRNLAKDPMFLQKQDQFAQNTLALEKLTEQLQQSSAFTKGLSDIIGVITGGLWESQRAARDRALEDRNEAWRRWENSPSRPMPMPPGVAFPGTIQMPYTGDRQ